MNFSMMAINKRYVKRIIPKVILFVTMISLMALISTMIVEKRITEQGKSKSYNEEESAFPLDANDDPVTPPYPRVNILSVLRQPQVRQRHFDDSDQAVENNELKVNKDVAENHANTSGVELFKLPVATGPLRDWHDYEAMEKDKQRIGMGEHGEPSFIKDESLKEREHLLSRQNGFNALLSDNISVNRSLPDTRPEGCKTKQYLTKLPTISVVVIFFNEYLSVLQRTMHSIKNRSPPEVLKQIILVDDFSDREYLHKQLEDYIADHFPGLISVVRLPQRTGLIGARLAGARRATGEILVFFDSHIEANVNWLPPLIEPIALNPKIVTCPIVDSIAHATFEYTGSKDDGSRGAFDWMMNYKQVPLLPEDTVDKTKPSKNPIMMGGLFAIEHDFFWKLGGYDEGLEIWGAEQYELSFKIWMCGGMMFDVPCSRVAHIFRGPRDEMPEPQKYNFVARNHKRVAEVWMDEYKNYLYEHNPDEYEKLDAGDLTIQKAVRERLKCKPFKWFAEVVAPDIFRVFPPVEPPDYASGRVQNVAYEYLCLDSMNSGEGSPVGLFSCAENSINPHHNQHWSLSGHHDMRLFHSLDCLNVHNKQANSTIVFDDCYNQGGIQFWYYDRTHQWLMHGQDKGLCMEAMVDGDKNYVLLNTCDATNKRMKWRFGFVNHTALDNFFDDLLSKSWIIA